MPNTRNADSSVNFSGDANTTAGDIAGRDIIYLESRVRQYNQYEVVPLRAILQAAQRVLVELFQQNGYWSNYSEFIRVGEASTMLGLRFLGMTRFWKKYKNQDHQFVLIRSGNDSYNWATLTYPRGLSFLFPVRMSDRERSSAIKGFPYLVTLT